MFGMPANGEVYTRDQRDWESQPVKVEVTRTLSDNSFLVFVIQADDSDQERQVQRFTTDDLEGWTKD